jgi:hypothetical protein
MLFSAYRFGTGPAGCLGYPIRDKTTHFFLSGSTAARMSLTPDPVRRDIRSAKRSGDKNLPALRRREWRIR